MIQCMPNSYKEIINDCIDQVAENSKTLVTVAAGSEQVTTSATTTATSQITALAPIGKTQFNTEQYSQLTMVMEDSDETESVQEEDPNDPEWFEPAPRIPRLQ